jgi:hypothetical protein
MTTVSSRIFSENPIHYLNLASRERVEVRRGKMIFQIMPKFENPSPSNDPYFADQRNVAELERRVKDIKEGKTKFVVLTPELKKEMFG